jgi:hypothetical protein
MLILDFIKKYFKNEKNCFHSGAFVFEDPNLKIFKELYFHKDAYKRISSHEKHFINKNIKPLAFGLDIENIIIKCNGKDKIFKTLLFFTFELEPKKKFTYVKLESHGFFNIKDIIHHSLSYLAYISNISKKNISHKVENYNPLGKKKYIYQEDFIIKEKYCKLHNNNNCLNKKQHEYNMNYRRGNEIFITNSQFKKIIINNKNNI